MTWSDPGSGPPRVGSEADRRVTMTHEFFNQIKRGSDRSGRQSFRSRCIYSRLGNDSATVADAIFASMATTGSQLQESGKSVFHEHFQRVFCLDNCHVIT